MVQPQETHRPPSRPVLEAYVNVTAATYIAKAGDRVIGVNRAGGVTVTLPTAEVRAGRTYAIKDESGAAVLAIVSLTAYAISQGYSGHFLTTAIAALEAIADAAAARLIN